MIPGLLAEDVAQALKEFIVTGYETETAPFAGEFRRLIEEHQNGEAFTKGPYISIGLPYKNARDTGRFFQKFDVGFQPYLHQQQAWERLASHRLAANTIVATGTGSGKTECFMYPLLDHCLSETQAGRKGIKAIVIYPMNALATDQAKRFARTIHQNKTLGGIRVGLFVGGDDKIPGKYMSSEQVITCKTSMITNPPDILLTNYKMLDYLLMRPKDQPLWAFNSAETLRYLVVDELHTFDGAQGTDLALLIRRLKARLSTPLNHLICVGTSATLGSDHQVSGLTRYASEVFDSDFSNEAIVAEQRMSADEFIDVLEYLNLNPAIRAEDLSAARTRGLLDYLDQAYILFFLQPPEIALDTEEGRKRLGRLLRCHGQVQNLLRLQQGKSITPQELATPILRALKNASLKDAFSVVQALLALLAHARDESGRPLVQLRVQLWTRELRRIVAALANTPEPNGLESPGEHVPPLLWFADDTPNDDQPLLRLPLVQCRECHGTAWLSRVADGQLAGQTLSDSLQDIYSAFFSKHSETAILIPFGSWPKNHGLKGETVRCCRRCGSLSPLSSRRDCDACGALSQEQIAVVRPHMQRQVSERQVNHIIHDNYCPYCHASGALVVFGSRAASLSAVAIHRLFSSRENDDKKLITFSDSVQDAAHRAGFFSARTWHNNIRMAISQLIAGSSEDIPLVEVAARFESFWLGTDERKALGVERYIREFTPPECRYRGDFERFEQSGVIANPAALLRIIRQRVYWQVCEDLSWRAPVGRSLNRVGVAALSWRMPDVGSDNQSQQRAWRAVCENWRRHLYDTIGIDLSADQAVHLLQGIMQHLLVKGAIFTDFLNAYVESGAQTYLLNRLDFVPPLGPSSPRPVFAATAQEDGFEAVSSVSRARNQRASWFSRWFYLFLGLDQLHDATQIDDAVISALDFLVEQGLLQVRSLSRGTRVWGINPQQLFISPEVVEVPVRFARSLFVPAAHGLLWQGNYELSATHADWVYEEAVSLKLSYFRSLYLEGDICRVIAHEHTGLLDRFEREQIETSFIKGDKPWEYNLLSATPTLEMGIDIGDLSSVLLCSVPPAQANYLQRAGRGGRRDGNSFVLTVANGRPHDLVFYADPRRMLDTPVESPAVFLKARHVLRRQLFAYAFDCWTHLHGGKNELPIKMQPVLDAVEKSKPGEFPYTLLSYLAENMQSIWEGFSDKIAHTLSESELLELSFVLFGGGSSDYDPLHHFVNARLKVVADERQNLVANIDLINKKIRELQKLPDDEHNRQTLAEFEEELQGFKRLRGRINGKDTLNFFTDEGLLPNYAFPEEGTTLHSIIFRRDESSAVLDGADKQSVKREYEYQRPAQAALVELAPSATFYAGNRKVKINRVETAKGRNIQQWRFCPRCNYSACQDDPKRGFHAPACPRCRTVMWADASAATKMLKMTQVYAYTNAKDAQLNDGSDDREPEFFNRQMLIDFSEQDVLNTWVLSDEQYPFGFEFIRKVDFLEVNFGRQDSDGLSSEIAGKLLNRAGFEICESCGKVQKRRKAAEHLNTCPHYRPLAAGSQERTSKSGRADLVSDSSSPGIIRCLYLYRQFSSEAMRIVLPQLALGGTDEQLHSFIAALQLGLKRQFGGKVDHLRVAHQSEPIGDTDTRRHFLVLYDSVPGGTGYLQELLANPDTMKAVFTKAWDTMMSCSCYDGTMDGCYRCLLEYRNSFGMEQTKKSVALSMLAEIIKPESEWRLNEKNLSNLKSTPWVDSELEARFPLAVEAFSGHRMVDGQRVRVRKDVINQKNGYRIYIGETGFTMEPHVMLGAAEGVVFQSESDFIIRDDERRLPPIAIFLDGYEYHRDIVQKDLLKRQALMHAGYIVWSMNWYDINQMLGDKSAEVPSLSQLIAVPYKENAVGLVVEKLKALPIRDWSTYTNFERLMLLLNAGAGYRKTILGDQVWCWVLATVPQQQWQKATELKETIRREIESLPMSFQDRIPSLLLAGLSADWKLNEDVSIKMSFVCGGDALKSGNTRDAAALLEYESHDVDANTSKLPWQTFWYCVNVMQFLPNFYAYTSGSKLDGSAAVLYWPEVSSNCVPGASTDGVLIDQLPVAPESKASSCSTNQSWLDEVVVELKAELLPLAATIQATFQDPPVVFYELEDVSGEIVAEAEIAWVMSKVVFLFEQQTDSADIFESRGWQVFTSVTDLEAALRK